MHNYSKAMSVFFTILVFVFVWALVAPVSALAEEVREAGEADKIEEAVVEDAVIEEAIVEETVAVDKMPGGWMLVQARLGGTTDLPGGEITFDDVPTNANDKTSFESNYSYFQVTGIDFIFFPTEARGFLLSASLMHQSGTFNMKIKNDDEYAYVIGLDKTSVNYYMSSILGGLGYRWLRGDRNQHGVSFHSKLGFGSMGMAIDRFGSSSNGISGTIELGTNYHYRFENRMTLGVQFDLRGYGGATTLEYGAGYKDNDKTDFSFGGLTGLLSLIIGWETL